MGRPRPDVPSTWLGSGIRQVFSKGAMLPVEDRVSRVDSMTEMAWWSGELYMTEKIVGQFVTDGR